MKKTIWIKIAIILIQVVPIVIYLAFEWKDIVSKPSQTIGLGAICAIVALFLVFKDSVTKFYKTPGALKFVLTVFVISGIGLLVGETLFKISLIELIAIGLSLPLQIIYNYITRPAEARDVMPLLNKILGKKGEEDDKND